MKLKFLFIAIIIFSKSIQLKAQQTEHKPKLKLADIYITGGQISQGNNKVPVSRFKEIVPQSELLNIDVPINTQMYYFSTPAKSVVLSAMAGFHIGESVKRNLRVGLSIFSLPYASAEFTNSFETQRDSFTSQAGEKLHRAIITNQHYRMWDYSTNLNIDAAYIYNFFPNSGISFFTGIGAGGNFPISKRSIIYYTESTELYTKYNNEHLNSSTLSSDDNFKVEQFKGKGNYGFNFYVPLGIDLQLGGNIAFLNKTHLIYEFRPVYNLQFGALGSYRQVAFQQNAGVKYSLF